MRRRRGWRALAVTAVVAVALAGCGDDEDDANDAASDRPATETTAASAGGSGRTATLAIAASEYRFDIEGSVPAGPTRLELENTGKEGHHAQLFRLNDGATMQELGAKLQTGNPAAILEVGSFAGGTGTVSPGGTSTATAVAELTPGSYAFMCFIEAPDGAPHLAKGMVEPLIVTEEGDAAEAPESDGEIELVDYGFGALSTLEAKGTYEVTNTSAAEVHEMNIMQLQDGATQDDVVAFFSGDAPAGPPKFTSVGGMQALNAGGRAKQLLSLDLAPGRYVVVCFVPSADGVPHVSKGMIKTVEVS